MSVGIAHAKTRTARERTLAEHTSERRADELIGIDLTLFRVGPAHERFGAEDLAGALGREVCKADDHVDALHNSMFRILLTHMMEDPRKITAGMDLLLISGNLERIADLATYQKYYGEHHAPDLLASARFVLPELTPPAWKSRLVVPSAFSEGA